MVLVQLLLPLYDNAGEAIDPALHGLIRRELVARFGGVTAYNRGPAEGEWRHEGATAHDLIIVVEVMAETLDRDWWADYRRTLETRLDQEVVVIRAQDVTLL